MWHLLKIEYSAVVDGKPKTITEPYLHWAESLFDIELQVATVFASRIKRASWATIAQMRKLDGVLFFRCDRDANTTDPIYQLVVKTFANKYTYMCPAKDPDEAIARVMAEFPNLKKRNFCEVKETPILGVYHYDDNNWLGDWQERHERLYLEGKANYDRNQAALDLAADEPSEFAKAMQAGGVDRVTVEHKGPITTVYESKPAHEEEYDSKYSYEARMANLKAEAAAEPTDDQFNSDAERYADRQVSKFLDTTALESATADLKAFNDTDALNANSEGKYPAGKAKKAKVEKRPAKRRPDWQPTA